MSIFGDWFVLGCLDWLRLFKLFRLVLVLLGCFLMLRLLIALVSSISFFTCFRNVFWLCLDCLIVSNCFSTGLFLFSFGYCRFCLVVFGCVAWLLCDVLCCVRMLKLVLVCVSLCSFVSDCFSFRKLFRLPLVVSCFLEFF